LVSRELKGVLYKLYIIFIFFGGQGPVVSYYQSGLEAGSPLQITQIGFNCLPAVFSMDGRLEGDIVHIDVGL